MSIEKLITNIKDKKAKVAVIGLGYVGLPLAVLFADTGFSVIGIDKNTEKISEINQGVSPITGKEPGLEVLLKKVILSKKLIAASDFTLLHEADVVLIAVETPVNDIHQPDYRSLEQALNTLGPVMKEGALLIVESTLAPGTMQNLVLPTLEKSSFKKHNHEFFLGHCPERVMPGKLLENLRNMHRVVGGGSPQICKAMIALYRTIVNADLDVVDWITAELVKTTENAYRDVQIAFANEVALICDKVGADVWQVRELVNKSPQRNMHFPGAGVGGHCIPKDPWLLYNSALGAGANPQLIVAARAINDSMPMHIIELLETALKENGTMLDGARVLVLGYAYLTNSDDVRNSPSAALVDAINKKGAEVRIHDPYVVEFQGDIISMSKDIDAIILMTAHEEYYGLNLNDLAKTMRSLIIIDGRNCIEQKNAQLAGFSLRIIGNGGKNKSL